MDLRADVVIPTCGRPDMLERTLRSIAGARWPVEFNHIIVVENGAALGAKSICEQVSDVLPVRYLLEKKVGSSFARNAGIQASDADIIVFLDDDVKVSRNLFEAYAAAFRSCGTDWYFGGPVEPEYELPPPAWLEQYLPPSTKGFRLAPYEQQVDRPCFLGANHAVPRALLALSDSYDDVCAFGLGGTLGEETRLQQRLLAKGYRALYVPNAIVWHHVPADRCSPQWALERNYRAGLTEGIMGARQQDGVRRRGGVPMWIWRAYIGARLHELVGRLAGEEQDLQFGHTMQRRRLEGAMAGYRDRGRTERVRSELETKSAE